MGSHNFFLVLLFVSSAANLGFSTLLIRNFKDCNPGYDYPAKIDVKFKKVDNKQLMDLNMTYPIPIDESVQLNVSVDAMADKKSPPVRLLSTVQKDMCKTIHDYLGEFMFEIERKVELQPGVCPIPKGSYHLQDYALNLDKIPITNLPFANLRGTVEATNIKDNTVLFCKIIKVANG